MKFFYKNGTDIRWLPDYWLESPKKECDTINWVLEPSLHRITHTQKAHIWPERELYQLPKNWFTA